ncbi:MAG TPA: ABC-2 family transporter protein [Myxococcota bacterium]|nr:ABC-2 family transporter protein [Myxococcota bacterium]
MNRSLEAIAGLLRVALMSTLQYQSNFLISFVIGACNTAGVALPLIFLFDHSASLNGWSRGEATVVVAFFMMMTGLMGALVEPNLGAVVEGVRSGTLDFMLVKPVDAQLIGTLQRVDPTRLWDLVGAAALFLWCLPQLPPVTFSGVILAFFLFTAGLASMYSLWLMAICTSFWFVRVDNLRYLLSSAADAGRWPITLYRGWVRLVFTVLLPVALVTSYPAMALLGRLEDNGVPLVLAVAVGALLISRLCWTRALRRYSSASS